MCRISGRLVRPSSLSERRIFKALGVDFLRVPRKRNPFTVARSIRKLAAGRGDWPALKAMLGRTPAPPVLPDSTSEPRPDAEPRAA
jgi:hypothetical protein